MFFHSLIYFDIQCYIPNQIYEALLTTSKRANRCELSKSTRLIGTQDDRYPYLVYDGDEGLRNRVHVSLLCQIGIMVCIYFVNKEGTQKQITIVI